MGDPTVLVAAIGGVSAVIVALVSQGLKRAGASSDQQIAQQVRETAQSATKAADESARQVGVDVGGVVSAAITAAVAPVDARLKTVEGEVRVLRSDLVPVAVSDRGLVLSKVAEGLIHPHQVMPIPESVSPLYPDHLRHVPRPKETP
ncbi:hypothetical protein GCM10009592_14760 [Brachybacterium rhamnosum]|uniref:DUF948 domain-containing protein n=1 Tax=Brachybacterium rhamnosum TaxID=173361 RepID=A0ABW4Q008_9MICO